MLMSIYLVSVFLPSVNWLCSLTFASEIIACFHFKVFLSVSLWIACGSPLTQRPLRILLLLPLSSVCHFFSFFFFHLMPFLSSVFPLIYPFLCIKHVWIPNVFIPSPFLISFLILCSPNWNLTLQFVVYNLLLLSCCISPIRWLFTVLKDPAFFIPSWLSQTDSERLSFLGWRNAALLCVRSTGVSTWLIWILFYRQRRVHTIFEQKESNNNTWHSGKIFEGRRMCRIACGLKYVYPVIHYYSQKEMSEQETKRRKN